MDDDQKINFEEFILNLDTFVHEPVRLGILLLLSIHNSLTFSTVQGALRVTSGNLNSHIKKLNEKKFIEIEKKFVNLRPRTVISINSAGQQAVKDYIKSLKGILNQL